MYPTIEDIRKIAAKGQYKRVPVCREVYADRYTPVEVMRTLRKASRHCYLLLSLIHICVDYSEKLEEIIQSNNISSMTVVRMEVPCCGGLEMAAKKALQNSGKFIPWQVVTISVDGKILD